MKKLYIILCFVISILVLSSCGNEDNETVKVIMPEGAPTVGLVKMIYEDDEILNNKVEYDVTKGNLISAAFTSKSHQIIVAPINVGAKLYSVNPEYVFAGTLTFGNLYLVSKEDLTLESLEGQTIYAFGQGSIPEIVLRKVLGDINVTVNFLDADDVSNGFISGNYAIVLLAEPALSKIKLNVNNVKTIDLQEKYCEITKKATYPQAGIFIKKDFAENNKEFVNAFLTKVEESVNFVNEDKESASNYYEQLKLTPTYPKQVLINSIPGTNIGFLDSKDSKELIETFFNIILEANGNLIGGKLPDDNFYLGN
ncbi:MAG TPA: hypothetical protein VIK84_03255 [Haloplasmataceae bacterium]